MAYGNLAADVVQSSTAGTPPQFNDGNGTQVGTLCRAWVQFVPATTTINASFNVSSITRSAAGQYLVNLTTALPDNKYSAVCSSYSSTSVLNYNSLYPAPTASVVGVTCYNGGYVDPNLYTISIFR